MEEIAKQIKAEIVKVRQYRKDVYTKMMEDRLNPNVDIIPHILCVQMFDGRIQGLQIALKMVRIRMKESK